MMTLDEHIYQLINSHLESLRASEDCPVCGAPNSRLIWTDDCFVVFQCPECESDWWPSHWMIDETTGAPVQTSPRVLDVLE